MTEAINQWQQSLMPWGLTPGFLLGACLISFFLMVMSFREFAAWFIKTAHLKHEVRELRGTIEELRQELRQLKDLKTQDKVTHPSTLNFAELLDETTSKKPTLREKSFPLS